MSTSIPLNPLTLVRMSTIGFLLGVLIIFFDYAYFGEPERQFIRTYQFQLWLLLLIVQTIFWAVVSLPLGRSVLNLRNYFFGHWREIVLWVLLFSTLLYLSSRFAPSCAYPLPRHKLKTGLLSYIGFVVALLIAIGILLVNIALRTTLEAGQAVEARIMEYVRLREYLIRILTILGVMTGLGTLAQVAKRNAILTLGGGVCDVDFTSQRVLLYGLYFTVLIIMASIPTFFTLVTVGRKLCDDALPMPPVNSEPWCDWYKKRKSLEEFLRLSMVETLRASVAVVAPLLGSFVSLLKL